jgi:hypothetical protein
VWFEETFPMFTMRQSFTFFRDYLELEATYVPGNRKVETTYFVGLYDASDELHPMITGDGHYHRYVPGMSETLPASNGMGGWYPNFMIAAPALDMRVHQGSFGVEWGYDEIVAHLYSPVWMNDMGQGGVSVFGLKYTSLNSVVPNVALGTEQTFHMFIRPYQYSDGEDLGYDAGYAQWIAPRIAATWGSHTTPVFPLTIMSLVTGLWTDEFRAWAEASEVKIATYSENPEQINFNYKSSQYAAGYDPATPADVPAEWLILNEDQSPLTGPDGSAICSPLSGPYTQSGTFRWQLIENDPYNDWWHGTRGVFWDEINLHTADNHLRSDYTPRDEFYLAGQLRLLKESRDSGYWDYVMGNAFSSTLHVAMVADLSSIEGWAPTSIYGIDFKDHVTSTMHFINQIPASVRPRILVYQNYDPAIPTDQDAVFDVLFGSARLGFHVALVAYSSAASQLPNFQMAEDMYEAMGCSRDNDTRIDVATLDLGEASTLAAAARMVVTKGAGSPTITFSSAEDEHIITNLHGAAMDFVMHIPSTDQYAAGAHVTLTSFEVQGNEAVFSGRVDAASTGRVTRQ